MHCIHSSLLTKLATISSYLILSKYCDIHHQKKKKGSKTMGSRPSFIYSLLGPLRKYQINNWEKKKTQMNPCVKLKLFLFLQWSGTSLRSFPVSMRHTVQNLVLFVCHDVRTAIKATRWLFTTLSMSSSPLYQGAVFWCTCVAPCVCKPFILCYF